MTNLTIEDFHEGIERSGEFTALSPSGRWLARQELNKLSDIIPSKTFPAEVAPMRCIELAGQRDLSATEWVELTGIGLGIYGMYVITEQGVDYLKWSPAEIAYTTTDWQMAMLSDNNATSLSFPCSPAELVEFVEYAIGSFRFGIPISFRTAVIGDVKPANSGPVATKNETMTELSLPEAVTSTIYQGFDDAQSSEHSASWIDLANELKQKQQRNRWSKNFAVLESMQKRGVSMNIESIWLDVFKFRGHPDSEFETACDTTATTKAGEKIEKRSLKRSIPEFLKKQDKHSQGTP
jgi:hypothetical protein